MNDSHNIEILNNIASLRDTGIIVGFIEQRFEVKEESLSSWFSTKIINKEVLSREHKLIFVDGEISKAETIDYKRNSHYKRSFYDIHVSISREWLNPITRHSYPEWEYIDPEEYFKWRKDSYFNRKYDDGIYNEHGDLVYLVRTFKGRKYEEKYEYKYDEHNNWIERREYENGKYHSLVLRQFKYI